MGFGHWDVVEGLPASAYTADQDDYEPATWDPTTAPPTNRHWAHVGNQRITLVTDNAGESGLRDPHDGYLWITEPRPTGTGIGRLLDGDAVVASTSLPRTRRAACCAPRARSPCPATGPTVTGSGTVTW